MLVPPSRTLTALATILWLASLFLPALVLCQNTPVRGLQILRHSFDALRAGYIAPLANVCFLTAAALVVTSRRTASLPSGRRSAARILASLAILLALTTFFPNTRICGYSWGTALWLLSLAVLATATFTYDAATSSRWSASR